MYHYVLSYQDEPDIECGVMCELAERDLAAA
jgi:hypothetical protein